MSENLLKKVQAANPLSLNQLSKRMGIPLSTLARMIRLEKTPMSAETYTKVKFYIETLRLLPKIFDASLLLPESVKLDYRYAAMNENGDWFLYNTDRGLYMKPGSFGFVAQDYMGELRNKSIPTEINLSSIFSRIPPQAGGYENSRYYRDLTTREWIKGHSPGNLLDRDLTEARDRRFLSYDLLELQKKLSLEEESKIRIENSREVANNKIESRLQKISAEDRKKYINRRYRDDESA